MVDAFLSGGAHTIQALAARVAIPPAGQPFVGGVYNALQRLREAGLMLVEPSVDGGGYSPVGFDWTGRRRWDAESAGTLVDVVHHVVSLPADTWPPTATHALRSALRTFLDLPKGCDAAALLAACRGIPTSMLRGWGRDAADQLRARNVLSSHTIANHTSALDRALRRSFDDDVLPILFPRRRPQDAWHSLIDEAFPLARSGRTPVGRR